jgi:CheY-like chemotaxis protein
MPSSLGRVLVVDDEPRVGAMLRDVLVELGSIVKVAVPGRLADAPLPSLAGIQILVVDDHQDTRDLIEQVLTHAGASVVAASSARDALRAVDGMDVVVTDYSMPGETGLWLLDRICERPRPIPVLVVTGNTDRYADEIRKAPFARVLRKSLDPWQLCEVIAAVLRAA